MFSALRVGHDLEGRECIGFLFFVHLASVAVDDQNLVIIHIGVREYGGGKKTLNCDAGIVVAVEELGDLDAVRVRHLLILLDQSRVDFGVVSVRQGKILPIVGICSKF